MRALEQNIDWYISQFKSLAKRLNGEASSVVHSLRRSAITRFGEIGFPTTRHEEWRFTNVAPIAKTAFTPVLSYSAEGVTPGNLEGWIFDGIQALRLVFINGHWSRELSSIGECPTGVHIGGLEQAIAAHPELVSRFMARYASFDDNGFTALNTAFVQDGAFLQLRDNTTLDVPVHLVFLATPQTHPFLVSPRNLIVVGKNCRLSIVETYAGLAENVYLTNVVTEVVVGEDSVLEHDKFQSESLHAYHVGTTHFHQGRNSTVTSNSIALGGAMVRNNVEAVLNEKRCECTLNGLSLATGEQVIDNHTTIDHASPDCVSHELYKSILDGKSKGVFNGKIFVRKDAQKTDAKQTNRTLLLSDEATIDTKPQLEIFADDVKCTHGATVGQLDEDQVFYLRSRGIGLDEARDLLTFAFASDVINRIHVEPLRDRLDGMLHARLRQGRIATNA